VFDRSVAPAECLHSFLPLAERYVFLRFGAVRLLFGTESTERSAYGYAGRTLRPAPDGVPAVPTPTAAPTEIPALQPLLRSRDAAAFLAVSERSLWGWTAPRGPIRAVRVGRSVRYALTELQRWIDSQQ
jgi:hypothetical protein